MSTRGRAGGLDDQLAAGCRRSGPWPSASKRTVATLPISPSAVGMSCISTAVCSPGLMVPSDQISSPCGPLRGLGRGRQQPRAAGDLVADLDVAGRQLARRCGP